MPKNPPKTRSTWTRKVAFREHFCVERGGMCRMFVFLMRLFVLHFCLGPFAVICRDCLWHRKNVLSTKLHDFRIGRGSTSHHARVEFREELFARIATQTQALSLSARSCRCGRPLGHFRATCAQAGMHLMV